MNIEEIRDTTIAKSKKMKKLSKPKVEKLAVDDQMDLPVGTEYDFIIKAKAEEIDSQKQHNNIKMDELIVKLGYMDYRDALACNKYIIEAKRSKEYNQVARARVLEIAFSKMNNKARETLQREASAKARATGEPVEEIQFEKIMDENSEYAQMY